MVGLCESHAVVGTVGFPCWCRYWMSHTCWDCGSPTLWWSHAVSSTESFALLLELLDSHADADTGCLTLMLGLWESHTLMVPCCFWYWKSRSVAGTVEAPCCCWNCGILMPIPQSHTDAGTVGVPLWWSHAISSTLKCQSCLDCGNPMLLLVLSSPTQ